jgi:hypothetical protein
MHRRSNGDKRDDRCPSSRYHRGFGILESLSYLGGGRGFIGANALLKYFQLLPQSEQIRRRNPCDRSGPYRVRLSGSGERNQVSQRAAR